MEGSSDGEAAQSRGGGRSGDRSRADTERAAAANLFSAADGGGEMACGESTWSACEQHGIHEICAVGWEVRRCSLSRQSSHLHPPCSIAAGGPPGALPHPPCPLATPSIHSAAAPTCHNTRGKPLILIVAHATWGKPRRLVVASATWMCCVPAGPPAATAAAAAAASLSAKRLVA